MLIQDYANPMAEFAKMISLILLILTVRCSIQRNPCNPSVAIQSSPQPSHLPRRSSSQVRNANCNLSSSAVPSFQDSSRSFWLCRTRLSICLNGLTALTSSAIMLSPERNDPESRSSGALAISHHSIHSVLATMKLRPQIVHLLPPHSFILAAFANRLEKCSGWCSGSSDGSECSSGDFEHAFSATSSREGTPEGTRPFGGTGISSLFTTGMLPCNIIRPYKAEFDSSRPVKREPLISRNRTSDRPR